MKRTTFEMNVPAHLADGLNSLYLNVYADPQIDGIYIEFTNVSGAHIAFIQNWKPVLKLARELAAKQFANDNLCNNQ